MGSSIIALIKTNINKSKYLEWLNNKYIILLNLHIITLSIVIISPILDYAFQQQNLNLQSSINSANLVFQVERNNLYKFDQTTKLFDSNIKQSIKTYGVEVNVDGIQLGIVKDMETINKVLNDIKEPYIMNPKNSGQVNILSGKSREDTLQIDKNTMESVDFIEKIELTTLETKPENIIDPKEMFRKLQRGDVQSNIYQVQSGDCVSCIAKKFSIPQDVIYQNNPWIQNDFIKIGNELDLTILKPVLSVRTIENRIENLEVPNGVAYEMDTTMRLGTSVVIVEGNRGLKQVTYRITKVNGQMIQEEPIEQQMLEQPIPKLIKQGTKVIPGIGSGSFAWPIINPQLTSEFGKRWGKLHAGMDAVSKNRSILSSDNGKVVFAGGKSGYGNCIIIDHQNGFKTLYAHLSEVNVTNGKNVEKGEKIGVMGSTGNSTGVHLHFEILKDNNQENPLKYIN